VGEAVNSVECGTVIEVDEGEDFIVVQGSNKSDEVKVKISKIIIVYPISSYSW
jgi:hypothetical protein